MKCKLQLLILITFFVLVSCGPFAKETNYRFHLSGTDRYVTTSKQRGAKFYLLFNNVDTDVKVSERIDYLELKTGGIVHLIFDTKTDTIFVMDSFVDILSINEKKYVIRNMERDLFYKRFFVESAIKYPYVFMGVDTRQYEVEIDYNIVKKGHALGI